MACSCILNEYVLACRDNIGGIQRVFIGCYDSDVVFGLTASNEIISSSGATVSYYKFEQEIETGSFIQNGQFSTENGTSFYEQVLEITLHKMDTVMRNRISTLGQGKWRVIVLDQRGTYWMMGFQNPVRVSAATPNLGKAYGDLNGAVMTFTGKEPEPAFVIAPALALTLIS
jgi:hypothetical protein